jgi:hypothetical protein
VRTPDGYITKLLYLPDDSTIAAHCKREYGEPVPLDRIARIRKRSQAMVAKPVVPIYDNAATKWREAARRSSVEFMKVAG